MKKWTTSNCFRSTIWVLLLIGTWAQLSYAEQEAYPIYRISDEGMPMDTKLEDSKTFDDIHNNNNALQKMKKYMKRTGWEDQRLKNHLIQRLNFLIPYYSSQMQQTINPSSQAQFLLPEILRTGKLHPIFSPVPRDNKRQGFSTWGGKRESKNKPFTAWGGKRDESSRPFTSWGGKREDSSRPFTAWGGKREENSRPFTAWGGKREENNRPFTAWGGKREDSNRPFTAWGGKRSPSGSQSDSSDESPLLSHRFKRSPGNPSLIKSPDNQLAIGTMNIQKRLFDASGSKKKEYLTSGLMINPNTGTNPNRRNFNPWAGKKRSDQEPRGI